MRLTTSGRTRAVGVAVVVLLAVVAAACGSSSKKASGGGATTASDVDPNGVLRVVGATEVPGNAHLDAANTRVNQDVQWMKLVEGTLLNTTAAGTIEPGMAKAYKLVDPQTVQLTLRDGIKFTDGTAYDAEAVKTGLLHFRDDVTVEAKASADTSIAQIDTITVDSSSQLTIKLKTAVGGQLVGALAHRWGAIPSPTQLKNAPQDVDTKAIGAGPYTVVSFDPKGNFTFKKNPDYWDAKSWRIGQIQVQNLADTGAQLAGLRAGTVDMILNPSPTNAKIITADAGGGVASSFAENGYFYINMCEDKPPFDNEMVRRALDIGLDRENVNQLIYGGLAEPAYGLWPKNHPYYEPKLATELKFDADKAKQLLAQAGQPSVSFEVHTPSVLPDVARMGEAMQAQLAKIGFTMKIVPDDILSTFVTPKKAGALMVPASRAGVGKYAQVFAKGALTALCGIDRQDIVDSLAPAAAVVPGDPSVAALFQKADLTIAQHAYYIPVVFAPKLTGYSTSRLGGTLAEDGKDGFPQYNTVYVKKK